MRCALCGHVEWHDRDGQCRAAGCRCEGLSLPEVGVADGYHGEGWPGRDQARGLEDEAGWTAHDDVWAAFQGDGEDRIVARVVTRLPSEAEARSLGERLVQERHAACVHVRPVWSAYRFDGEVRSHDEWELDATTTTTLTGELEASVFALHPYRVPAIERHEMRVSVTYAAWVRGQVG